MYLKALKIQGFKSFPEPTVIEFHEGITAIVGPNGSGKSNVSDAIRWVLGEQSSRSLRASKMAEVIFNGTETRRQMGYAEVSILFDNSDHALSLEFDTVEVTRRYYRSGESEYLINKAQCRLKDIVELFADTGIGRDGYSIIGQGRVDEILSDKAEDRRRIFDEAVGIVKYKLRKQEAERKLNRTEQNLERVTDILGEIEQRLKPLAKQAEKTKKYNAISRQMLNLDVALTVRDVENNDRSAQEVTEQHQLLVADRQQLQQQKAQVLEGLSALNQEFTDFAQKIETKKEAVRDAQNQLRSAEAKGAEEQRQLSLLEQEQTNLQTEQEQLRKQVKEWIFAVEQRQSKRKELAEELALKQESQQKCEQKCQELDKLLAEQERMQTELVQKRDQAKEQVFLHRQSLLEQQSLLRMGEEQQARDNAEMSSQSDELKASEKRLQELAMKLAEQQKELEQLNAQLAERKAKIQAEEKTLLELTTAEHRLQAEIDSNKYRLQTLNRLMQERAGFNHTIKQLLSAIEQNKTSGAGVLGPLSDLIEVDSKYALAIEIALGANLQNIVTAKRSDAVRLIDFLKKERLGRATFLPLDVMRGRVLSTDEYRKFGKELDCIAADAVRCQEKYQDLIDYLLGRILIATDMEHALRLSDLCDRRFRIVTLTGDVINAGGSMTGGRDKHSGSGILARSAEQRRLAAQSEKLAIELTERRQKAEVCKNLITNLEDELKEFETAGVSLANSLAEMRNQHKLEEQTQERLHQVLERLEDSRLKAEQLLEESKKQSEELKQILNTSEKRLAELEQQLDDLLKGGVDHGAERDKLREELTEIKVAVSMVMQRQRSLDDLEQQMQLLLANNQQRETDIEQRLERIHAEKQALAERGEVAVEELAKLKQTLELAEQNLAKEEFNREEAHAKQQQLFAQNEDLTARDAELQIAIERLERKSERIDQQNHDLKNRLWETYEIAYPDALEMQCEVEGSIGEQREALNNYRKQLKELGAINHAAIEEYQELSERYTYITDQKQDIEGAKRDLLSVIKDLEQNMYQQFSEQFALINQNFSQVFHDLFMGGKAELVLSGDNLLECGIEIKAQPPGKRLQSLALLSGGERSLTAIALMFAIFKLRPSPFCVLDEVESALDDANVLRFTEYIRNYTDKSQFVLITHRKGTMEAAERLYGVTMKERGVSKLLSLALTDAD